MFVMTAAVVLAGCGGASRTGSSRAQREGAGAGRALVCVFSQAKFPTPQFLALDFDRWVAGKLPPDANQGFAQSCPKPPAGPLPPAGRKAAARVVLQWARSETDRLGPRAIAYLQAHGVH